MTKQQIPIWLDCDPGNDDAFAILLSIFNPRYKLLGISTVHGNAPLSMTTHNTLAVLDLLNIFKVKVYKGEERPLINSPRYALDVHGVTGIGGVELPKTSINKRVTSVSYVDALRDAIEANAHEICLVATGTMTNISLLIEKYPDVIDKIKYISVMGGSFGMGNATPYAEFNFHTDPHAIKAVVDKLQDKMILSPLNLTHKIIATADIRNQIYNEDDETKNSPLRKAFYDILMFYSKAYAMLEDMNTGPPLHDPVAVYSLLPIVDGNCAEYGYKYLRRKLDVVIGGPHEGESIIVNKSVPLDESENEGVYIGESLDAKKFWNCMLEALNTAELNLK
ncbi:URH1 [Candida margitis]|uniref:URH1 n=1 Tax=Candida margitis TaxID=1775924 RepID=UPI0022270599|nr:URH1 [Candida margitis]KAI5969470.1 URH1 [Candida margitis]